MRVIAMVALGLGFFFGTELWAWAPTWGGKLLFTTRTGTAERMAKRIAKRCRDLGCRVVADSDGEDRPAWRVVYGDGWWFRIVPAAEAVEVRPKPSTLAELEARRARLQEDIFDAAAECGAYPLRGEGGAALQLGLISTFTGEGLLFRNFIVDTMNHVELALGAMADSPDDARSFGSLEPSQREAFRKLIADVDAKDVRTMQGFARRLILDVYAPASLVAKKDQYRTARSQALNVLRLVTDLDPEDQTLELRAVRPPFSADQFLRTVALFDGRLRALKRHRKRIPFVDRGEPSLAERVRTFRSYVTGAGLRPLDYLYLLPKEWKSAYLGAAGCAEILEAGRPLAGPTS